MFMSEQEEEPSRIYQRNGNCRASFVEFVTFAAEKRTSAGQETGTHSRQRPIVDAPEFLHEGPRRILVMNDEQIFVIAFFGTR